MSLNFETKSANFTGSEDQILSEIEVFLKALSATNKRELHLVHALVFPKDMAEENTRSLNLKLSALYSKYQFSVLGGDTSSGKELSIFISTIAC